MSYIGYPMGGNLALKAHKRLVGYEVFKGWIRLVTACAILIVLSGFTGTGAAAPRSQPVFEHGVASGDVTSSTAVLWTRVDRRAKVKVEVYDNPRLHGRKVFKAKVKATATKDFTAKATARGLEPNTAYYYQWRRGRARSPVGTFTTAPAASTSANVSFAYSGDSDGTSVNGSPFHGNFEVLDAVREESPDFFVYLGDTIYSDSSLRPSPATTLDEYRGAYKENREIEALPELLGSTSIYAQWDDHEVMNDYDGETVDPDRYAAGRRAFFEYMPISDSYLAIVPSDGSPPAGCAGNPVFKKFNRGSDVDIFIPDERSCRSASVEVECQGDLGPTLPSSVRPSFGLPPSPPPGCLEAINDPGRTMLGTMQKQRLKNALRTSDAQFKFVISELAFQQFYALPYDRWEGYAAERAEILNFIRDNNIENVIFLTTDNHANIVNEVFIDRFTDPEPIAQELIAGPIATFTLEDEILAGYGPDLLMAFHGILNLVDVDCRNLDTFAYGMVDVEGGAGTATIELKDANGATLHDDLDPSVACTKTIS